jgi:hypothetical protein
MAPLA